MNLDPLLKKHCTGKIVLEVGCAGQAHKFRVHKIIRSFKPSYLLGIDIQENEIEAGKKQGYNVMVGNIEDELLLMDMDRLQFDVIVMTEVIEHLNNCGLAINNIKKLMKPKGVLIITTPNCFTPKWLQQMQQHGKTNTNPDHVMWFDWQTLTALFGRFGMKVEFINDQFKGILAVIRKQDVSK